jgi:two-component system alkaline phosphatase synthesis response regulator PhoP
MSKQTILVVDDEQDILELLSYTLEKEGFNVLTASNGTKALEILENVRPDLVILDVMMPEMDGVETCRLIREDKRNSDVIIAFLSARGEDYSQIAGFEAGADDYINKPIKPRVLATRVQALLRRKNRVTEREIPELKSLLIDRDRYLVIKEGKEMSLPKKEFELLSLLCSRPGHVFTRDFIMSNIWGHHVVVGDRTIDVHIRKLREKIGDKLIKTVKGVGYKFVEKNS